MGTMGKNSFRDADERVATRNGGYVTVERAQALNVGTASVASTSTTATFFVHLT
jgi:hypothetical protein